MKKLFFLFCLLALVLCGCSPSGQANVQDSSNDQPEQQNSNVNLSSADLTNLEAQIAALGQVNLLEQYNQAIIKTNLGDITVEFYNDGSPLTVNNFLNLAQQGFYNDTKFHRVIKDFMIQGGDPNSKDDNWADDGTGGPGYKFQDEINSHLLIRGSLAMANAGKNTNGSQFFIVTAEATPWLDGMHTNFGKVINGLDVVEKIEASPTNPADHPQKDITIKSIELMTKK